jgi:hypothetical protein
MRGSEGALPALRPAPGLFSLRISRPASLHSLPDQKGAGGMAGCASEGPCSGSFIGLL